MIVMPDRFFIRALLRRIVALWVGVRVIVAMFGFLAAIPPVPAAPRDVIVIVLVVASLAAVELHRRREFLFFANLGVAPTALVMFGLLTTLLLELVLAAAVVGLG